MLTSFVAASAGTLSAQQRQPAQPSLVQDDEDGLPSAPPAKPAHTGGQKAAPVFEHDPDLDAEDQLAPSQIQQQMPAAVATPNGGTHTHVAAPVPDPAIAGETIARPAHAAKPHLIACSGIFARNSSHAKLAAAFHARNITFTEIDSDSGAKVPASVLFAKDPKQRLEVWWSNPAGRSDVHLIVINGQSDWIAPGELHLGLTLAELERLNGRPFKLSGFDKDATATLSDWNGGDLSALTGGCKLGVSLRADPKTPAATLASLPADRAFTSADATLRAANPTVSEILVAY